MSAADLGGLEAELQCRFTYHKPTPEQLPVYQELREKAHELARLIVEKTPVSREQSLALTHLEEAVMWANAGLARRST